jgi:hypothetical protein
MRLLRNILIIVGLALIVAAVPGGGNAATAILTAITIAFLATIAFAAYVFYRQNQFTFATLTERQRALVYGALGVIALMIAGADEMLGGSGLATIAWIVLIALSVFALWRVWVESHSY